MATLRDHEAWVISVNLDGSAPVDYSERQLPPEIAAEPDEWGVYHYYAIIAHRRTDGLLFTWTPLTPVEGIAANPETSPMDNIEEVSALMVLPDLEWLPRGGHRRQPYPGMDWLVPRSRREW